MLLRHSRALKRHYEGTPESNDLLRAGSPNELRLGERSRNRVLHLAGTVLGMRMVGDMGAAVSVEDNGGVASDTIQVTRTVVDQLSAPLATNLHPVWDPLRKDPRFQTLIDEYVVRK